MSTRDHSKMYAIGLCFDENFLLPGLVTMMSVAHSTPECDRRSIAIRIITNDLTRPQADAIAAFSRALGFGSFDLEWRGLHDAYRVRERKEVVDGAQISATTYLRFDFSPDFVQRPHLVYLDCDLLVLDDISSPFNSVGASQLGAVRAEFNSTIGKCPALPGFAADFPSFHGRPYFNAGALWVDTNLMPSVKDGVHDILGGPESRYIRYNDQDAMNLWLLKHDRVVQLPGHLNRFEIGRYLAQDGWVRGIVDVDGPRDASVLHFIGRFKPWLKCCPTTPGVRFYRSQLREARRLLEKLGIQTIVVREN
jgi:lipopolysaccharide biosynthesis glycosyltransferase